MVTIQAKECHQCDINDTIELTDEEFLWKITSPGGPIIGNQLILVFILDKLIP